MSRYLFTNGVSTTPSGDAPPISNILETHPGAYTTTRTHTHGGATILLFYSRHLSRLCHSLHLLLSTNPSLLFGPHCSLSTSFPSSPTLGPLLRRRIDSSIAGAIWPAIEARRPGEELAVTALVSGNSDELMRVDGELGVVERALDVYLHVGMYVPPAATPVRVAVVEGRRDWAEAKYSDWVRLRKPLEKLRPPSATELLLSDNGDRILEGSVTNFFVVCLKENNEVRIGSHEDGGLHSYEIQTAPVGDGALPGVIRQLVIEVCLSKGISIREVAPCWSQRDSWKEAFITSSLRLVQAVETIQAPSPWISVKSKSWSELSWVEKQFQGSPAMITTVIQSEIMKKAGLEGYSIARLDR